jgi:hypothetical protein
LNLRAVAQAAALSFALPVSSKLAAMRRLRQNLDAV